MKLKSFSVNIPYLRKLIRVWDKFLWLLIILGLLLTAWHVEIPCTKFVLNKVGKFAPQNLSVKKITFSIRGYINVYGVELENKEVVYLPKARLLIDLNALTKPHLICRRIIIDTLFTGKEISTLFSQPTIQEVLQNGVETQKIFSKRAVIQINLGIIHTSISSAPIRFHSFKGSISEFSQKGLNLNFKVSRIKPPQYPLFTELTCRLSISKKKLVVKSLSGNFAGGHIIIKAGLPLGNFNNFKGNISFNNLDLKTFSRKPFVQAARFSGRLEGLLFFRGSIWDKKSRNIDGHIKIRNLQAAGFPFQNDFVIQTYMPALKNAKFDEVKIKALRVRGNRIFFDSVFAEGKPLSFFGKGRIILPNEVKFGLNCTLTEEYYDQLSQLAKDGIGKNKKGKPAFYCTISGDMNNQSIFLKKVFTRVIKTKLKRFGRKIKNIFK